jgi:hypothetical protein
MHNGAGEGIPLNQEALNGVCMNFLGKVNALTQEDQLEFFSWWRGHCEDPQLHRKEFLQGLIPVLEGVLKRGLRLKAE